jgi:outer membrane protein assembly factor BamD
MLKSTDNAKKYDLAMKYYNQKDFYRALQLFDQLLPVYRGTTKAEEIAYCYAYSYYKQSQYSLAAYQFNNFASSFPKSNKTEECIFMSAYCKYLDSPPSSLDQTSTQEAIKEFQLFINMYPNSSRINECNNIIDKLRLTLESKVFNIAKMYFQIEDYTASITAFKSLIKDYPDTKYKEEALYYILKSNYKYALNSISIKKAERLNAALEAYNTFKNNYPTSNYIKECNNINKITLKELSKFKNQNSDKL